MTRSRPGSPYVPRSADAFRADRRLARNRSLMRNGVLVLVVIVGLGTAWFVREIPNEDLPPALELTQRFEAAYREVRAGELALPERPERVAPGVSGAQLALSGEDRWVLTGEVGRDCYVLWWDEAGSRRTRTLTSALPCEPSTAAMSSRPETFERIGRAVEETEATAAWELVLPDPISHRVWFLPALILGGGIGLAALVRITIAILTGNTPSATRR